MCTLHAKCTDWFSLVQALFTGAEIQKLKTDCWTSKHIDRPQFIVITSDIKNKDEHLNNYLFFFIYSYGAIYLYLHKSPPKYIKCNK